MNTGHIKLNGKRTLAYHTRLKFRVEFITSTKEVASKHQLLFFFITYQEYIVRVIGGNAETKVPEEKLKC